MGLASSWKRVLDWTSQRSQYAIGRLALLCFEKPLPTLAVVGIVSVGLSIATVGRLSVDADLAELLPQSFRSVQDLERLKKRFGGLGYVAVVARGAPDDVLEQFVEDVSPKLAELETVRHVDYRRPTKFFEDRALFFLDVEDLDAIHSRLKARWKWEKRQNNPLYLSFEDETEPPPLEFDDIQEKYGGRGETSWVATQLGETYYIDREAGLIAMLVKPAQVSTDLDFCRRLVGEVKATLATIDLDAYHPDLELAYAGNYTKKVDMQEMLERDVKVATTAAVLLVLLYLGIHFRRVAAVGLIIGPMCIGLIWIHGIAGLLFGTLNILTAFIGAILMGLGIDHGIHLLSRFEYEMSHSKSPADAVTRTFGDTGRAVLVAALTTSVAFGGLGFSEFRAFKEFGVLAAIGMLAMVLAYMVALPAMLGLAVRFKWRPRAHGDDKPAPLTRWLPPRAFKVTLACLVCLVVLMFGFRQAEFNYNFRSLLASDLPSFKMDSVVDGLLGFSQTPVVVLTDDQDEEREVAAAVRARKADYAEETKIDFVATGADLIPLNQEEKQPIIRKIGKIVKRISPKMVPERYSHSLDIAKRMTNAEPYTRNDLPDEVQRTFQGIDGYEKEGFVLVFARVDLSDGANVRAFAHELRDIPLGEDRRIHASGEPMILADIIEMVSREAPPVLGFTLVLVFLTIGLMVGSMRQAILCMVPAMTTLLGTIGLLHWTGLDLNYINIVLIPVLFGIGVDGGVHLVTRFAQTGDMVGVHNETGRAIAGSILTTGLGFGALMVADHAGLESLGNVAVLGLAVNLLASLIFLPALLTWKPHWVRRAES